jgi:protein-S-isoprenylcysteine O-methyltransferase Ste14
MYSGVFLFAFGWTIMWGALIGMFLAFILFFVLDRKANEEERWLTKKYPEYTTYKMRVKKMIPFIY